MSAAMSPSNDVDLTTRGGDLCPVCRAPARAAIDVESHRLFACPECGCWSSDALVRGASTSFDPGAYHAHADADAPRWRDLIERRKRAGRAPASVLDVGCGRGAFLRFAAGACPGARLAGIELDAERAIDARSACPGARIVTGDAEAALAEAGDGFDLVTLWDVFEHLTDPGRTLRALAGRLAPGGAIYVQTIHEQSLLPAIGRWSYTLTGGRVRVLARRTHEAHHLVFFSQRGLDLLVAGAGLRIVARWWDRLAFARMDGPLVVRAVATALLATENALGNGLFVNLLLEPAG